MCVFSDAVSTRSGPVGAGHSTGVSLELYGAPPPPHQTDCGLDTLPAQNITLRHRDQSC